MRRVRQAGLLLHSYSGDVNTEAFEVTRVNARFNDFVARLLEIRDGELLMAERN
jgi:hypothetical protein